MFSFEFFIALRYIRSKRRTAFISTITYLSFFGIAIGVAVLTIVLSVMNGFEHEVKSRFIGNDSHLRVRGYGDRAFRYDENLVSVLDSFIVKNGFKKIDIDYPEIKAHSPYIEMFGMLKGDSYTEGAQVRGVDELTIGNVSLVDSQIVAGKFDLENRIDERIPGIILGKGLADKLAAIPGEKIKVISPAITSTFSQPPVGVFRVTGIFESGLAEIDGGMCFISIKSAQKLFRMKDKCNGVYVNLKNVDYTDKIKEILNNKLEFPLSVISWKDMHRNLYAWMAIEKMMMGTVLSLIVIIAAFNILSSLIMIVMEKKKEVGILMALGTRKKSIMKIFIFQGMIVGILGTIFGLILGFSVNFLQLKYKFLSLPSDIYFIDSMPILMTASDFLMVAVVSILLTFLSTIYPSYQAGKLSPAQIIREN